MVDELKLLCVFTFSDSIDLNRIFTDENSNNVFGVLREGRKVHEKNTFYYTPIYIGLLALIIAIIAYSVRGTLMTYGVVLMFSSVISYILHLSNYMIIMQINKIDNPYMIQALKQLVQDVFSSTTRYSLVLFIGFVTCVLGSFFFEAIEKKRIRSSRFVFVILVLVAIGYYGFEQYNLTENYRLDMQKISTPDHYLEHMVECVQENS